MKRIVPFVSGCDEETTNLWLEHLQAQMSEYKIIPFEELSEEHKLSSTVAIVAMEW